jgi:cytochrome P450
MVAGGNDTTTGLLGGAAELLTAHPEQRSALRADPRLIPDAVEELLRLTSPVQGLARTTTTDVEIAGVTIPAGRKVMLLYGSANRDPREFGADAEELDVTRRPHQILTFGFGAHYCLGAAAARLQAPDRARGASRALPRLRRRRRTRRVRFGQLRPALRVASFLGGRIEPG